MFERTDIDEVTVDDLFVDVESKILSRGLRGNRIGGRRAGNAGGGNPLKRVFRRAVYDPNARNADPGDDATVQDGTIYERLATPKLEVPGSVLSGNPLNPNSPARELVSLVKKPKNPLKRKKRSAKPDFDEILRVEEEDNKPIKLRLEEEAKKLKEETKKIQDKLDRLNNKFRSGNEEWETNQDIELARESLEVIATALAEDQEIWDRSRLVISPREVAMGRLQVMRDRLLLQQSHFDQLPDREFEELLYNLLKVDEPDWAVDYFKGLALQSAFERYGSRGVDEIVFSDDLDPDIPWQDVVSNPPISDSGRLDLKDISDYIDSQYKDSDELLLEQAIHDDPSNFYEFLQAYEERESKDILAPNTDLKTDEDLDTFWEARHREMYGHENAVAALSSPEGIALAKSLQSVFESKFGPDSPIGQLFEKYDNPTPLVVLASHAGSHWAGGVAGQYYEGVVTVGVVSDFEPRTGAYILISEHQEIERAIGERLVKGGPDDHVATVVHEMGHAFHEVINNNVTPMVSVTDLSREWDRLVDAYFAEDVPLAQRISGYSVTNKLEAFAETFTAVMLDADTGGLSNSGQALVDFMRRAIDGPRVSETSSFDGSYVPDPGVESSVSERISERFSHGEGFSGVRPALSILDDGSWDDLTPVAAQTVPGVDSDSSVSNQVSNLIKAIQDLEDTNYARGIHSLLAKYDDATVAAAARIIFDSEIDASPLSPFIAKSKVFDIPDVASNPTAVFSEGILEEFAIKDPFSYGSESAHDIAEAIFHRNSEGLHDIFESFQELPRKRVTEDVSRELLSDAINRVFPSAETSVELQIDAIVRRWDQDNPIPEFVRNFDAQVAENPDWEFEIPDRSLPDGSLADDRDALDLSDALDNLDYQESLLSYDRLGNELELLSIEETRDGVYKELNALRKKVRERRDQLLSDHMSKRYAVLNEAKLSVSSLPSQDVIPQDVKDALMDSVMANEQISGSAIDFEQFQSIFTKQLSALSSTETLLTMMESDPSIKDALNRLFDDEQLGEVALFLDRFKEGFDPLSKSPQELFEYGTQVSPHSEFLTELLGEIRTRRIENDSISDRAKATFLFDRFNHYWAQNASGGLAWDFQMAVASLTGGLNAKEAERRAARSSEAKRRFEDYQIMAKAIYSTTQSYLEKMGISEDKTIRLSRAMSVGPEKIADTPEAKKLQMQIEQKRSETVDLLKDAEEKLETNGDELEKIYANPLWAEAARASRAGESLDPAQSLLIEKYLSTQKSYDKADQDIGDVQDILRKLDSDEIGNALNLSSGSDWVLPALLQLNGLASFATITQREFGSSVYHVSVPRSRIFSLSMLGFGCVEEYEVLVIGDGDDEVLYETQGY